MLNITRDFLLNEVSNCQDVVIYLQQDRFNVSTLGIRFFEYQGKNFICWYTKAVEVTDKIKPLYDELKSMVQKCRYEDIIVWNHDYDLFVKKFKTDIGL